MDENLRKHIEALRTWLTTVAEIREPIAGLSSEERLQLKKINRAIEELKRLQVNVPEGLIRLKLDLATKDNHYSDADIDFWQIDLDEMVQSLKELLKTTRQLRDRFSKRCIQKGSKKHYAVSLLDLIKHGYLSTSNKLELQWLKDGDVYEGKICPDGSIIVKTPTGSKEYKSISTAASDISGRSLNGWKHWLLVNQNGSRTPLIDIRTRYLKNME